MRVAFAGTPEFARAALRALHEAGHDIVLVLTQPDRPAGRGMKLQASPVKQYAQEHGLSIAQPQGLRLDGKYATDAAVARAAIEAARADVMVVAAYGLILPQWVLDVFSSTAGPPQGARAPAGGSEDRALPSVGGKYGCLNIHASLLPRWRGAAPIHRAIEAGDRESGVTIMQMDAGLDTGAMLQRASLPIAPDDTTGSLHDKLAEQGARLIVDALAALAGPGLSATPQPTEGVSYAHKIDKQEAVVDWSLPADQIARRVRAFNPFPGATTSLDGAVIKIWQAQVDDAAGSPGTTPGTVVAADGDGILVQCGQGRLRLRELQSAGGKRLAAADWLRGHALSPGAVLGR